MKKFFILIVLAFSLTGCNSQKKDNWQYIFYPHGLVGSEGEREYWSFSREEECIEYGMKRIDLEKLKNPEEKYATYECNKNCNPVGPETICEEKKIYK